MTRQTLTERMRQRYYSGPQYNGTAMFYDWIREYTNASTRMLNFGAGPPTENPTRIFKGEVAEIIGADVDACVLDNHELDSSVLVKDGKLPFSDASFDVVYSDYVLEHVEHPQLFLDEVHRVLKPSGSYFFRTPNIYHYVALVAYGTPHWFHEQVANRVRNKEPGSQEPWPTFYRLNSRRAIRKAAEKAGFAKTELRMIELEPSYMQFAALPFALGLAYERFVNLSPLFSDLRGNVFGRLQKSVSNK